MPTPNRYCDGLSRRQALQIGGSGLVAGLSLPSLLAAEEASPKSGKRPAESIILLFMEGGPSTIDMWDMKPEAPIEIRGPYKQISTNVAGTFIGEHLPLSAKIADKYTILRSHSHNDNGHNTGYHYCLTGYKADFADGTNNRVPNNVLYPSIGSVIAREVGPRSACPVNVNLPVPLTAGGPGFYGAEYAPFVIESDPAQPDFQVKDLPLVAGIDASRLDVRRRLLSGLDKRPAPLRGRPQTMSAYYEKAYDLITNVEAKKAFDIHAEPEEVRRTYGYNSLGQSALMARRLVEAGCRFVGVDYGSWDTHFTCFPSLENDLIPDADKAWSALITDLDQRGLLDTTLVVMMGEMGRTPRVNAQAGRDHWSMAQSVLLAGGGVKRGAIIGATDKQAAYPTSDPVSIEDLLRSLFHQIGVDSQKIYHTPLGRPVPIVNGGRLVHELFV